MPDVVVMTTCWVEGPQEDTVQIHRDRATHLLSHAAQNNAEAWHHNNSWMVLLRRWYFLGSGTWTSEASQGMGPQPRMTTSPDNFIFIIIIIIIIVVIPFVLFWDCNKIISFLHCPPSLQTLWFTSPCSLKFIAPFPPQIAVIHIYVHTHISKHTKTTCSAWIMLLVCMFSDLTLWYWTTNGCALWASPHLVWQVHWCHPCSAHIWAVCWWDFVGFSFKYCTEHIPITISAIHLPPKAVGLLFMILELPSLLGQK